jgi:hypothetical protein
LQTFPIEGNFNKLQNCNNLDVFMSRNLKNCNNMAVFYKFINYVYGGPLLNRHYASRVCEVVTYSELVITSYY